MAGLARVLQRQELRVEAGELPHARTLTLRRAIVRRVSPSAGTRPDAAQLVDLDELLAAYRRPPEGPVAFGTSGHRGTSLKGTFTEAHVLAISEAICAPPQKPRG